MNTDMVPVDAADIERSADPAEFVVATLERAKTWLATALEHGDIDQIVELKSQAEALRIYAMSKQLGKDAELSAAEIVRRAERGLGLTIRRGQQQGTVATRADGGWRARRLHGSGGPMKTSSDDVFGCTRERREAYALTDDVDEDLFEAAIRAARATGTMSRAGLIRRVDAERHARSAQVEQAQGMWETAWHGDEPDAPADPPADRPDAGELWIPVRGDNSPTAAAQRRTLITHYAGQGYTSQQIADVSGLISESVRRIAREIGVTIPADVAMGRSSRKSVDSNRIVRETAATLDGLVMGVGLVDVEALDPTEIDDWVRSLSTSIRALNRLIKQMKERTQ